MSLNYGHQQAYHSSCSLYKIMEPPWNDIDRGKQKINKTSPSATLSAINPIWTDLVPNLSLRGESLATNCLNNDMTPIYY
jgi:hypothetical protein